MNLCRDEKDIIAKALMAYKRELRQEITNGTDLEEYNYVEIGTVDMLAEHLSLDPEYFQPEERG